MSGERRFPPEKIASLDAPERELHQPAAPLVDLVAAWGPRAILDLGVGTGYFALPLCARLPGARVIGLDAEARMLEALAGRAEAAGCAGALESIEAGAELIPLPDSSVDVVLMVNLYHELDDRPAALGEIRRVLRGGGRLLVCDWDPGSTAERGPPLDHRISMGVVESELEAAGFADLASHALYASQYTLSARA